MTDTITSFADVLRLYRKGELSLSVYDATVQSRRFLMTNAQGRLYSDEDGELVVELFGTIEKDMDLQEIAPGAGKFFADEDALECKGAVIPYFELHGITLDFELHPHRDRKLGQVKLTFRELSLRVTEVSKETNQEISLFLEGIPEMLYEKESHISDDNPINGGKIARRDWFETGFDRFRFRCRKNPDGAECLFVDGGRTPDDLLKGSDAFLFGLGFLSGHKIPVFARTSFDKNGHESEMILFGSATRVERRPFHPAIDWHRIRNDKRLDVICCAAQHALLEEESPLVQVFETCWDVMDNDLGVREMAVAVGVESLANYITKSIESKMTDFAEYKARISKLVSEEAGEHSERFGTRFSGLITGTGFWTTRDRIKEAGSTFRIEVSDENTRAWRDLRNPRLHGSVTATGVSQEEAQQRLDRYYIGVGLMYKLALGMIGYSGTHINYTKDYWPAEELHAEETTTDAVKAK